uniref:WW domain-containing protein n=1 Tax=Angiostrongylus cantonensis TaxID=6313 RepID=A0A0K0D6V7_ANGCA
YPHTNRYYYQSQYAPEPWDRPKSTFSHQSHIEDKKPVDSRNSPLEIRPNGSLPYKVSMRPFVHAYSLFDYESEKVPA